MRPASRSSAASAVLAALLVLLCLAAGAASAIAAVGEAWFSRGDDVNVRAAPALDAAVVMRIDKGHKVVEFGREGPWVRVRVSGGEEPFGWVHSSLLGRDNPAFANFKAAVEHLNGTVRAQIGKDFFTHVQDMGDGIVQVTATDLWFSGTLADRQSNLRTIFNLWDAADGTGLAIMVRIADRDGELRMHMKR